MTITLPDELKDALERKAREAGFATIDEYVCWLIQEPTDAEVTAQDLGHESQEALEAHLLASLASPPITVGPGFWEDLQKKVAERAAQLAKPQ